MRSRPRLGCGVVRHLPGIRRRAAPGLRARLAPGPTPDDLGLSPARPPREATRIAPAIPADPGQAGPGDTSAGTGRHPRRARGYLHRVRERAGGPPPASLPRTSRRLTTARPPNWPGPPSGETPRYEDPSPETPRPQTAPGASPAGEPPGHGGVPGGVSPGMVGPRRAREPAPWDALYRQPPPGSPLPWQRSPARRRPPPEPRFPTRPRDVPVVTPGGYPPPPPGLLPALPPGDSAAAQRPGPRPSWPVGPARPGRRRDRGGGRCSR